MSELITVGYSTRKHNPEFIEYLKKSSGFKKINVIEKINNGEKSLSQTYNEILNESETDIVVLCHDDLYFDSTSWYSKIIKHFEKSDFGILGVAGTTEMPKSGMWWEDRSKMFGIVNHESNGKKWESRYSSSFENSIKEVVVVDGLFIALHKKRIKQTFDESVSGFHMYDINFCFRNFIEDVKIGVITNIRITHKSIGQTNEQWEINKNIFADKYKDFLPVNIKFKNSDKLNIILSCHSLDEMSSENSLFFELIKSLSDDNHLLVITSDITEVLKNKFTKEKINYLPITKPPGFILGDGNLMVNTPNGPQKSQPNQYYKQSEPKIDVIIYSDLSMVRVLDMLYPNSNKIYVTNNVDENLSSIITNNKIKKILSENKNIIENDKLFIIENLNDIKSNIVDFINEPSINSNNQKVKIISGYTERGGSTSAFINLTNLFNDNGIDCTLYGPHNWHLDKCKSGLLSNLLINEDDTLICHFINPPERPNAKNVILSCHEKNMFKVGEIKQFWDKVIFLHEEHRQYHSSYKGEYGIIPNLKSDLKSIDKPEKNNIAGIVGSIDENKQTHISIKRAIDDGCEKVYVFGSINDKNYYETYVKDLFNDKVIYYGTHDNKQEMYNMIGKVYHSSISEVACLVKDECYLTNTKFFGNNATNNEVSSLTNEEILNKWKEIINN
jgi:hypothetical protein